MQIQLSSGLGAQPQSGQRMSPSPPPESPICSSTSPTGRSSTEDEPCFKSISPPPPSPVEPAFAHLVDVIVRGE